MDKIANDIWFEHFHGSPEVMKRYHTGHCHYVYYVEYLNEKYVLRVAAKENRAGLKASIYWIEQLRELEIPIPKVLVDGTDALWPFAVMSYIEGQDLGEVYHNLTEAEKRGIVLDLVEIQERVRQMPIHQGYGYLASYVDHSFKTSWLEVVLAHLERSKLRMSENDIFSPNMVDRVIQLLPRYEPYLMNVKAQPFLDDTTTKNVLIHEGKLSGIVDLDWICFGDQLYTVALTKMALLSMKGDTTYVDYWIEALDLESDQHAILNFYTLCFCLDFMSEKGMKFNKDEPITISEDERDWYLELYETLLKG